MLLIERGRTLDSRTKEAEEIAAQQGATAEHRKSGRQRGCYTFCFANADICLPLANPACCLSAASRRRSAVSLCSAVAPCCAAISLASFVREWSVLPRSRLELPQ